MNEIKVAKWRYSLVFFFLLTSVSLAIDGLDEMKVPLRNVLELILKDAVLPAVIVVGWHLLDWARRQ